MVRWFLFLEFILFALFFTLAFYISAKRFKQQMRFWITLIFIPWLFGMMFMVFFLWDQDTVHFGLLIVGISDGLALMAWLLERRSWRIEQRSLTAE